jgi:hypothetical protein
MLRLTLEQGAPAGAVFVLKPGENLLGRSHSAAVRLGSPDISGTHAKITVSGDEAVLENLSRFGTRVNEASLTSPVTLVSGQRIALGRETVLLFSRDSAVAAPATQAAATVTRGTVAATRPPPPAPSPAIHEAATGKGIPVAVSAARDDKTRALPSSGAHEDEPLSRADWTTEVGASGETRAMQTRAAAPEEIEFLKVAEQKRNQRRLTLIVAVAIPVLILAFLVWPRTPPPEKEFAWPKNEKGAYLDAFASAPSGSLKEGGYDICFPGGPGASKKTVAGGVIAGCRIGRDLDVPMAVILMEEVDKKYAGMDREAVVADWMQQAAASGGRWNFDKPSPSLIFIGRENGLPTVRVTYQREGSDGSWFGVATLLRYGIRLIVVRAEAPAVERARAERILSAKFIRASTDFERAYWEPVAETPKVDDAEVLRQVRQELDRMAPATWSETESRLAGLLTKAARDDNKQVESEAVPLLARLREREALWFNSQQLSFDAAVMQGSPKKAGKIAEFTKGIFSNMEDQRYYTVRKWKVEP